MEHTSIRHQHQVLYNCSRHGIIKQKDLYGHTSTEKHGDIQRDELGNFKFPFKLVGEDPECPCNYIV